MPTQIENNLQKTEENIRLLRKFIKKYPVLFEDTDPSFGVYYSISPTLEFSDAALVGEVLGREGWTRQRETYASDLVYHWLREIDGVRVKINRAEKFEDMSQQPVPPSAFPLCLEEVSPVKVKNIILTEEEEPF